LSEKTRKERSTTNVKDEIITVHSDMKMYGGVEV
jgi:hypothetical protein